MPGVKRVAFSIVCLLLILFTTTEALFERRSERRSTTGQQCDELPVGTWNVEHYRRRGPNSRKTGDLIGRSLLNLTRSFENAYSGNGAGIYFTDNVDSVNGYEFVYQMILSFNTQYCVLTGSLYNLQTDPRIIGAVRWQYDGKTISGPVNILEKQPGREAYDVDTREWFELSFAN